MHCLKSGASGTDAFGWPLVLAAMFIQWLKSSLLIELPSTVATAFPGTPPQPATTATSAMRAQRVRTSRTLVIEKLGGRGDVYGNFSRRVRARLGLAPSTEVAW